MLKTKFYLAAILSATAIASGIVLGSVSSAQSCPLSKYEDYEQERYEQADWLRSPWVAVIILPGMAIAAALSVGDRFYKNNESK